MTTSRTGSCVYFKLLPRVYLLVITIVFLFNLWLQIVESISVMGKTMGITSEQEEKIFVLLRTGKFTQRQIARRESVSHQTVSRIANSIIRGRSNRFKKRKTTIRDDRQILKVARENPLLSSKGVHKMIMEMGIKLSHRTIRRRLCEGGIKYERSLRVSGIIKN